MGIHQNSPLIDVAEVRKLHALTGDALVTKQANDEALAKIIKGEDKRILLVIGPCSSDNEEAVLLLSTLQGEHYLECMRKREANEKYSLGWLRRMRNNIERSKL